MKTDEELMSIYMSGFEDKGISSVLDLDGDISDMNIITRAYFLGVLDFEIGDDLTSWDSQTNEHILDRIKKGIKWKR